MELTSTRKWIILLLSLTALFILILGGWWIYLASTLYIRLEALSSSGQVNWDVVSMLKWEGLTFFISTLSLLVTIIYLYIQDWKKAHGLQSFFASMTHELKTPLASISLQAQVLRDILLESEMQGETKEDLKKYNERIIADAKNLEKQIDNSLQLAKLEWSSKLKLSDINILEVVKRSSGSFQILILNFIFQVT
jgi:signal transduction histidine kinase